MIMSVTVTLTNQISLYAQHLHVIVVSFISPALMVNTALGKSLYVMDMPNVKMNQG